MGRSRLEERLRKQRRGSPARWMSFFILALLLHIAGGLAISESNLFSATQRPHRPLSLVILEPPESPEEEPELPPEEPKRDEPTGQIVELPPPPEQVPPTEADYLAEFDVTVPNETRAEQFEVNPEVLAPTYSEETKLAQEDLIDLNVDQPSTGAQVGDTTFQQDSRGSAAAISSPWQVTNREGTQSPVPASHRAQEVLGAPQNDLLNEKLGEQTALNAKEYLYAGYLNRIRRLVNFYWEQNIDNLPASERLIKSSYATVVEAILTADGMLEMIAVTDKSGSDALDNCVVRAFEVAGPFPNPPEGLIERDGRVYLPPMSFTVRLGQARMRYDGIDPRAGVQFPGILKSPR